MIEDWTKLIYIHLVQVAFVGSNENFIASPGRTHEIG